MLTERNVEAIIEKTLGGADVNYEVVVCLSLGKIIKKNLSAKQRNLLLLIDFS